MVEVKRTKYAGILDNDMVDGDGIVVSFWVQGCPIRCHGCQNPQTWIADRGYDLPDNYLDLIDEKMDANGIKRNFSLLGGEPFATYNLDLSLSVVQHVKEKFPDRTIYCWTGYYLKDLLSREEPEVKEILKYIDVLVDGPFEMELRDTSLHLRGSGNQTIHFKGEDF